MFSTTPESIARGAPAGELKGGNAMPVPRILCTLFLVVIISAAAHQAETAAEAEETPPVGKVVELTVHDDLPGTACAVDLDTGKLIAVPTPEEIPLGGPEEQWLRKRRIDIVGETSASVRGVVAIDMKVAGPLDADNWEASADEITALVAPDKAADMTAMTGGDEPPATWAFRTREGAEGILQIMGIEGREIRIRYRLTHRAAQEEAPRTGAVEVILIDEETGAPIEGARVVISQQAARGIGAPGAATGREGTAVIEAPPATYRGVFIHKAGYTYAAKEAPQVFTLAPGARLRLPIPMKKSGADVSITQLALRLQGARSILGQALPPLEGLGLAADAEAGAKRPVAVAFWNVDDRISREVVAAIHDSGTAAAVYLVHVGGDGEKGRRWLRENEIDLPCGAIAHGDAVLDACGVREIPWIVCADESGMVTATTGFSDDIRVRVRHYLLEVKTTRVDLEQQTTPTTD